MIGVEYMKKKDTWKSWVFAVIVMILMTIGTIAIIVAIEYGRYLFLAPDGMDFSTFYWLDTLRR